MVFRVKHFAATKTLVPSRKTAKTSALATLDALDALDADFAVTLADIYTIRQHRHTI